VYANRRRLRGERSKRLQRLRSEKTERTFAHVCETGGGRRCWLRGLVTVTKRYLIQVAARNLGLIPRKLFGIGTARGLQGPAALLWFIYLVMEWIRVLCRLPLRSLAFCDSGMSLPSLRWSGTAWTAVLQRAARAAGGVYEPC
jgi:hypothetical protein